VSGVAETSIGRLSWTKLRGDASAIPAGDMFRTPSGTRPSSHAKLGGRSHARLGISKGPLHEARGLVLAAAHGAHVVRSVKGSSRPESVPTSGSRAYQQVVHHANVDQSAETPKVTRDNVNSMAAA
jgi:hypothetical protein